jgi:hypothetical protein
MRSRDRQLRSVLGRLGGGGDRPLCRRINESCVPEGACRARETGRSCWIVADVACCPRNDKSRCCYCRVYLAYLEYKQTGRLHTAPMESVEDPRFSDMGRRAAGEPGGDLRILPPEDFDR